eukprot:5974223-Pyramimonas_sp.AAC.1
MVNAWRSMRWCVRSTAAAVFGPVCAAMRRGLTASTYLIHQQLVWNKLLPTRARLRIRKDIAAAAAACATETWHITSTIHQH